VAGVQSCNVASFRANAFLRSLSAADVALIAPLMTITRCRSGERLGFDNAAGALIHFPVTLVVSMGGAAQYGCGLIGREGLIGWPAILGQNAEAHAGQVLFDGGTALALPVRRMQVACFASPTLAMSLLRFVQSYTMQLTSMLEHSLRASLQQRLSAWLLMLHDRIDGDTIHLTHQVLAGHLGVRRASITDALHLLEGEQAVRCDRRTILIRHRERLETFAGPAYARSGASCRAEIAPLGHRASIRPIATSRHAAAALR
jgi:CRP-like cAMP-binding protein